VKKFNLWRKKPLPLFRGKRQFMNFPTEELRVVREPPLLCLNRVSLEKSPEEYWGNFNRQRKTGHLISSLVETVDMLARSKVSFRPSSVESAPVPAGE